MYPELFEIPFIHLTVKSYGLMMVVGFLSAISLIRHLSRNITPSPHLITNAALYSLIAGVAGARLFYVIHHFDQFQGRLHSVFAIWQGGLELLGGVILAISVIFFYLWYHKLPIRRYLDILAVGLMLALAFGCFLNGCCFGKPTELPWAVRFPYASHAYKSQIYWNPKRNRPLPQLKLPPVFSIYNNNENGIPPEALKHYEQLTPEQKNMVDKGPYRCLPVHPTELYSSVNAAFLCLILYLFRRRSQRAAKSKNIRKLFSKPGCTFGLMFVLYGITRFFIEFLRDDNPFERAWWAIYRGGTVSQNFGIYMAILGLVLMLIFQRIRTQQPK